MTETHVSETWSHVRVTSVGDVTAVATAAPPLLAPVYGAASPEERK